jgi:hypothetical protein
MDPSRAVGENARFVRTAHASDRWLVAKTRRRRDEIAWTRRARPDDLVVRARGAFGRRMGHRATEPQRWRRRIDGPVARRRREREVRPRGAFGRRMGHSHRARRWQRGIDRPVARPDDLVVRAHGIRAASGRQPRMAAWNGPRARRRRRPKDLFSASVRLCDPSIWHTNAPANEHEWAARTARRERHANTRRANGTRIGRANGPRARRRRRPRISSLWLCGSVTNSWTRMRRAKRTRMRRVKRRECAVRSGRECVVRSGRECAV